MGSSLKHQFEFFLKYLIERLQPSPQEDKQEDSSGARIGRRIAYKGTNLDEREVLLGALIQFVGDPSFMINVYVNYDCDLHSENIFEGIIDVFAKVC